MPDSSLTGAAPAAIDSGEKRNAVTAPSNHRPSRRVAATSDAMSDPVCPLCGRPIPPGAPQSDHHLVPRLKGGGRGAVVRLHQICGIMYQTHQAARGPDFSRC